MLQAKEMEFLAEQELISIRPFFHLKGNGGFLNCIGGDFGPFNPSETSVIPLWLAISLKKMQKCRILQPEWLNPTYLSARLESENNSDLFEKLPFHYIEIASLLLTNAIEDIEDAETIRTLLEDLQNIRQNKIRNGLRRIAADVQKGGTAYAVQMNNISALEISSVRKFMIGSLDNFYQFSGASEESASLSQSQTMSQMSNPAVSAETPSSQPRLRRHR